MTGTLTISDTLSWLCSVFCVFTETVVSVAVILAIIRNSQLRNGSFWLILHLTIPQIARAWCYFFLMLAKELISAFNIHLYCKLMYFCWSVTDHTAFIILTAIAWDRYSNIVHPLKAMATAEKFRKRAPYFAWGTSVFFSLPYIFSPLHTSRAENKFLNISSNQEQVDDCVLETGIYSKVFSLTYIVTGFLGPLMISAICYFCVGRVIWKRRIVGQPNTSPTEKSKLKIVKMSVVVLLLFFFTWAPFAIGKTLEAFKILSGTYTVKKLTSMAVGISLMCVGTVAIPISYAWFSPEFRQSFKKVLYCRHSKQSLQFIDGKNEVKMDSREYFKYI